MDPNDRGPEEQDSGSTTRAIPLIAGEYLLTVNPVDGSEIEPCPPGEHPGAPRRRTPESRAERERAAVAPLPTGISLPDLPLLERTAERERLLQLLRRGRSVRLTGAPGSGRSSLLAAVAAECADLAPDGVIRLSGCRRTASDVLYELFAAVHDAPRHRPDRAELEEAVRGVGAVVLLDDAEFGGQALDSLLDATPECAFLITAAPGAPAPSADAPLEEVALSGISRAACRELMEHIVRRPLTEDEAAWVGDLWFESEGLPLRFVQAGALLRQRDAEAAADGGEADGEDAGNAEDAGGTEGSGRAGAPLPTLAEGAAPAALLAARLSDSTREVLRFAVALGGVLPHPAHLPALVDDADADASLGELLACGLVTTAGTYYRLAPDVTGQLADAGYADGADDRARTAAQHYAWWTGHPSVTPERVAQEAEAVLAAVQGAKRGGHASAAVLLARTAAPMLAASLHWGPWERILRGGQEAARTAGEVAEEAYFHHDLGVLALCTGHLDRARAELEASIGLRGVLADRRGTVAGRRALALVEDRFAIEAEGGPDKAGKAAGGPGDGGKDPGGPLPAVVVPPAAPDASTPPALPRRQSTVKPPGAFPPPPSAAQTPSGPQSTGSTPALDKLPPALAVPPVTVGSAFDETPGDGTFGSEALTRPTPFVRTAHGEGGPEDGRRGPRGLALRGTRRNVFAAGAGALLAALVGTVVTIGMTSGSEEPAGSVNPAVTSREDDGITVDEPAPSSSDERGKKPGASSAPAVPGEPSGSGTGSASPDASESDDASEETEEEKGTTSGGGEKDTEKPGGSNTSGGGSGGQDEDSPPPADDPGDPDDEDSSSGNTSGEPGGEDPSPGDESPSPSPPPSTPSEPTTGGAGGSVTASGTASNTAAPSSGQASQDSTESPVI
ncbi:ATP-binding protein [Streptomyces chitinivorans]|uniref:ATP-binding protein n=1 Tax=Streptomyces chitinivorans TaxID=1257027 RepID=A0ABW7HLG4_9ACTN|nr:ATP-binding protein [Streptomyces chitinivorans]MDH2408078.1 ATP-binding protein [Streptomyces chitinivorans]